MKVFALVALVVQALVLQGATAQCLGACNNILAAAPAVTSCGCGCGCRSTVVPTPVVSTVPTTVVQVPSVANTLADTLSLLTVSSLLAETLPLGPAIVSGVAPVVSYNAPCGGYGCSCGCGGCGGCGYNGYNYGLGYNYLL